MTPPASKSELALREHAPGREHELGAGLQVFLPDPEWSDSSRHGRGEVQQCDVMTITLALATLGVVSVPSAIVEPIIAGSIAVVALENIFHPKYTHWRLGIVFTMGLVHGLGFAGALAAHELPAATLVIALIGFNVGVELGQLAVIAMALAATGWIKDAAVYRKRVVVPGSVAIAAMGAWWMVTRVFGG